METDANNYLKIQVFEPLLLMEWVGHLDTIDYRRGHQAFLETALQTRCRCWLLNYKESGDVTYQDNEWTVQEWLPQALQAAKQVEKISVVVPTSIFNKIPVRIITSQILMAYPNVTVAFFDNLEEAREWLLAEESIALPNNPTPAAE